MKRLVAGLLSAALIATASPALATEAGRVGGSGDQYHVTNGPSSSTSGMIFYGRDGDDTYVGDWDGNGTETLAVRRGNTIYISNAMKGGAADRVITYGRSGDQLLVGDWNGDGIDTFAVRRGDRYYIKNSLRSGNADRVIAYGRAGDTILVGDWDNDGIDTFAVRRGNRYYVRNTLTNGNADIAFRLGRSNQRVIVGKWRREAGDTFGLVDGQTIALMNNIRGTRTYKTVKFGTTGDRLFALDWNGDRVSDLGVRRRTIQPAPVYPTTPVLAYGTLRVGREAFDQVRGTYMATRVDRTAGLDLWLTSHEWYSAWPWALPGTGKLTGDLYFFSRANYPIMIDRLDRWEGYTPGGDVSKMNYVRQLRATDSGVSAWVYVATPWRQTWVRNQGRMVPSGDITRY